MDGVPVPQHRLRAKYAHIAVLVANCAIEPPATFERSEYWQSCELSEFNDEFVQNASMIV